MMIEELDLAEGESFRIGSHLITILDIDGENVTFRVENMETGELHVATSPPTRPK